MHNLLAGQRVLIVEDEMLILLMIEDMLADLGCTSIVTAGSVDQALAKIAAHTFDAAMLDSNLAGQSSDAIANVLATRGVPFFFASGQKSGGAGYPDRPILKKPFSFEQVEDAFRQLLSASGEQRP